MERLPDNTDQYEYLYKSYFKKLYNYGRKFTEDSSLIKDSIQELFIDLWNRRQKNININSPGRYYFSSFRYVLLRKLKENDKNVRLAAAPETEPDFYIEQKIIATETNKELQQKIKNALNTLTSRQREALFLKFYEGMPYEEVAAILGISVKATYKIIARSLTNLKLVLLSPAKGVFPLPCISLLFI